MQKCSLPLFLSLLFCFFVLSISIESFETYSSFSLSKPISESPSLAYFKRFNSTVILFITRDGDLICTDLSGAVFWDYDLNTALFRPPALADIDNDGFLEIVISTFRKGIFVFDEKGVLLWNKLDGLTSERSQPSIADIDGDGYLDIVVGLNNENIVVLDYKGDLIWKKKVFDNIAYARPLILDLQNDGPPEIIMSTDNGHCLAFSNNGFILWNTSISDTSSLGLTFSKSTSNNKPIFFFASNKGTIAAINSEGKLLWSQNIQTKILHPVVFADLNNDGIPSAIVFGENKHVFTFSVDGKLKNKINMGAYISSIPLIISKNGVTYFLYGGNDKKLVLTQLGKTPLFLFEADSRKWSHPIFSEKEHLFIISDIKGEISLFSLPPDLNLAWHYMGGAHNNNVFLKAPVCGNALCEFSETQQNCDADCKDLAKFESRERVDIPLGSSVSSSNTNDTLERSSKYYPEKEINYMVVIFSILVIMVVFISLLTTKQSTKSPLLPKRSRSSSIQKHSLRRFVVCHRRKRRKK